MKSRRPERRALGLNNETNLPQTSSKSFSTPKNHIAEWQNGSS